MVDLIDYSKVCLRLASYFHYSAPPTHQNVMIIIDLLFACFHHIA